MPMAEVIEPVSEQLPWPTQEMWRREFILAIDAGDDDAAEALVSELTPADEPPLLQLAQSGDTDRRWWAVRGLAVVGSAAAIPAIDAALAADDPALRACAALAVGHLHTRHAQATTALLPHLAELLADDHGFVRQAAADGLALCGDDAAPALAEIIFHSEHEGARTRAASALRKIATMRAAGVLYHCLNDRNHLVHTYAFEALDEMGLLENVLVIP